MKPYSAVIFDMDGVIVNSEPLHERAFLETFAQIGHTDSHGIHFPDYYGRSDQSVWPVFNSGFLHQWCFQQVMKTRFGVGTTFSWVIRRGFSHGRR